MLTGGKSLENLGIKWGDNMNYTICLHRIHKNPNDVEESYHKLNMSVQLDYLLNKLVDLNQYNLENNQQTLVTFDDGWKDVLSIPDDFFLKLETLQPVIFLTDSQIKEDFTPLPLHKLYSWMSLNNISLEQLTKFSINRDELKDLREQIQHETLSNLTTDLDLENQYLNSTDIKHLRDKGWRFASHGPEHSDLRLIEDNELIDLLSNSMRLIEENNLEAWIAWPEGRWDDRISRIAEEVGFTKQFGLIEERRKGSNRDVILRKLW